MACGRRYDSRPREAHLYEEMARVEDHHGCFRPVAAVRVAQRLLSARGGPATSHLALGPRWLNTTLEAFFSAEARVLPRGRLPFGVSLFAIAEPG